MRRILAIDARFDVGEAAAVEHHLAAVAKQLHVEVHIPTQHLRQAQSRCWLIALS
jgi:predicted amino acid-binding ACT domain protein